MKAVVLFSGLGNQMFQWAFLRGLEARFSDVCAITNQPFGRGQHNGECVLEIFSLAPRQNRWIYGTNSIFHRIFRRSLRGLGLLRYYEPHADFFSINRAPLEVYIGYFMDLRHFERERERLRADFTLKTPLDSRNLAALRQIQRSNSLGIHIRRGDFLSFRGGIALGLDYYRAALKYATGALKNLDFFIFSDDLEFCRAEIVPLIEGVAGGKNAHAANPSAAVATGGGSIAIAMSGAIY